MQIQLGRRCAVDLPKEFKELFGLAGLRII